MHQEKGIKRLVEEHVSSKNAALNILHAGQW